MLAWLIWGKNKGKVVTAKEMLVNYVTPSGFRDVLSGEAVAREKIKRTVADLFAEHGYLPIETPALEVMDVLQVGGRVPGTPFKLFDSKGDLLAMRPDVTLQIARMCATRLKDVEGPLRFRYTQRVFRETENEAFDAARETTQMGVECIGEVGASTDAEIIGLFAEALQIGGARTFALSMATVGVLRALLDRSGAPMQWKSAVLGAYHDSDYVELDRLTSLSQVAEEMDVAGIAPAYAQAVRKLARIRGGREAIEEVRALVTPLGCTDGLDDFARTFDELEKLGLGVRLLVDFSVMSSFDYYTGIVFEAYSPYLGSPLGSGGRYDNMLGVYGAPRPAAGFAFSLEQVMAASAAEGDLGGEDDATCPGVPASKVPSRVSSSSADVPGLIPERPLRIAVPKGSLNKDAIECLSAAGLDTTGLDNPGRQLIISNPGVDFIIVRPSDAPVFVALGAADCGICGRDSLLESTANVVELADLKFGECRFVVAESVGTSEAVNERYRKLGSIRIATKYPNITQAHYAKTGVQVEIVKLHGNIELAPLTGMAERIVDITATGTTLRENNLEIVEEVLWSTARFFANTCAFRTDERIVKLARVLQKYAEGQEYDPIAGSSQPSAK